MCHDKSLQFTPVRRRVLEILLAKHHAVGAYDILDELLDEGLGSQPPIAYRALDRVVCLNGPVCCEGKSETGASAPEYCALFGSGTQRLLALFCHDHNHSHDHSDAPANCQHTQEATQ